ncbi:MAG TPA: formate/nitrite transporter family protein [Terracidiphilus sp.]|nr:formate/nitrite transporter family protein [Terracidiphilus sp.]
MPQESKIEIPEPEQPQPAAEATAPQKSLGRPSAKEIFTEVAANARRELRRTNLALAISGFGGGAFLGLSALGMAFVSVLLGHSSADHLIASMFYPVGFIVVIIGRSQLFTENTLYPAALVLAERKHILRTLRLWTVVLPANLAGALGFAALAAFTPGIDRNFVNAISQAGTMALDHPFSTVFWSAVIAGWLIALTAWLVSGSHSITGSVMVIWMLTFFIALGNFAHCIATSCDILVAVLAGHATWTAYGWWLLAAAAGNIVGGVVLVAVLEYGQAIFAEESEPGQDSG